LQWLGVALAPPPSHFGEELVPVLLHLLDESAGRSRLLVPRAPHKKFEEYGREIDSLLRQPVIDFSSVRIVRLGGEDSRLLKLPEPVRQNVAGDSFARFLELLKGSEAAYHQVANDQ
jgi:hypothetical protein